MIYIEAPNRDFVKNRKSLFLAGGITDCPDWQSLVVDRLRNSDVIVFNPRRKNFPIDDPTAAEKQITWEHDMFRQSDMISFWFCSQTIQPIVLYELGAWTMTNKPIVIGIDPDYPRRQDVEIQTKLERPDIVITYTIKDFVEAVYNMIDDVRKEGKCNMKHLATIQAEFLKKAAQWEDLMYDAQVEYLRLHPKSKRKITKKPGERGYLLSELRSKREDLRLSKIDPFKPHDLSKNINEKKKELSETKTDKISTVPSNSTEKNLTKWLKLLPESYRKDITINDDHEVVIDTNNQDVVNLFEGWDVVDDSNPQQVLIRNDEIEEQE